MAMKRRASDSGRYLLIQFPPTEGQSDDSVVRQLLSCYLKKKKREEKKISAWPLQNYCTLASAGRA